MVSKLRTGLIAAGVALIVAVGLFVGFRPPEPTRITAYFSQAVGVYAGSDVRILGVKTGKIASVRASGSRVKVVLEVDPSVGVPDGARAVAVAPSLVSDRYIQLTPAYETGPKMASGATIPLERTATPLELDKVYASITKLADDLGPNGLNSEGAVSRAIGTGAENMRGNGRALGATIEEFGKAAKTLTGSQEDLFATITNLSKFTGMLKANDGQVRQAQTQLAEVTRFLADDRETLGAALRALADALGRVEKFIRENRTLLKTNVEKLGKLTQTLVNQRKSLAEALDVQPLAAGNMLRAYDPKTGTLMGRGNLNELVAPLPAAGATAQGGGR
ncbi:MCE family protein [Actinomadura flavalba]|uniref:MCE family protein n=1 Tax=Actinomadura flavalba TaxID=1120938 RepID=UPI00036A643D|nr:MCE family protein [Actinomadura flavalba]